MYGYLMYEVARERIADQRRAARRAGEARAARAAARGRHAGDEAEQAAVPPIPDFADEMFGELRDAVPAPRTGPREEPRGRHARTSS